MPEKPDLTNYKNIFNYVVYGLAGIVSILYFSGNSEDKKIEKTYEKSIDKCEEENSENRETIKQLLSRAYNLEQTNLKKDTIIANADSVSAQKLKSKAQPLLNKIKKFTK